jgi:hypothetical protein
VSWHHLEDNIKIDFKQTGCKEIDDQVQKSVGLFETVAFILAPVSSTKESSVLGILVLHNECLQVHFYIMYSIQYELTLFLM